MMSCPTCGQKIRNKRGQGAAAVKDWKRLPPSDMKLLCYLIDKHPYDWFEKAQLMKEYSFVNHFTTPDPLSGRLSDLVGLKLVEMKETGEDKQKVKAAYNSAQVLYRLNLARANEVIEAGGRLDVNNNAANI